VRGKDIRHVGKLERRASVRPGPAADPASDDSDASLRDLAATTRSKT
jgi:hypothetical protein